jgi:uncharacterized phiE125 gp8 family phage protein
LYASLRIVTEPAVEPVDLDTVKRHCRVDSDYDDLLLTSYAITARSMAEQYLNRALITQELTLSIMQSPPPMALPMVPQALVVWPLNWPGYVSRPISIPRARCQGVTEVLFGDIENMQPATSDQYSLNLDTEPATITLHPTLMPMFPSQSMRITFMAGYGDDADTVPAMIKHGIMMLTASLYENRGDVAVDVPQAIWNVLTPYRLWSFAGG